eukprot:scaffold4536_cov113-Isochrysis_galbana.AAC.2
MHECDTIRMLTFAQPACTSGTKPALTSTVKVLWSWSTTGRSYYSAALRFTTAGDRATIVA